MNIILIFLIIALCFFRANPKLSFKSLVAGIVALWLAATPAVADFLLNPIEDNYTAFTYPNKPIDYIVVLGCDHVEDPALPPTSQLRYCSLARLVEAVRIYQQNPSSELITSGGSYKGGTPNAEVVKNAAQSLGIPESKITTEVNAFDTYEEAQLLAPRLQGKSVVLVTSASHMPRAMAYFKRFGIDPMPAPAGNLVKNYYGDKSWTYYLPNAATLNKTTTAWYETLGRIVQWFTALVD
ncbi:ElyC/SanA/YdcF family protein [Thalassotalea agarivorans]|nr:ElyC/SanA/YdcF family protein [Thalassotalea agarivorans]